MNQFAYYRIQTNNILTIEEMRQKDEIIRFSEERRHMKDGQCDFRISKVSLEQFMKILDVRRKCKKNKQMIIKQSSSYTEVTEEEMQYI